MENQIDFWDKTFSERKPTLYPYDSVVSFVFRNYPKNKEKEKVKILDVGCAGGNNIFFVAEQGFSAYGIDGSKNAIEIGRKRLAEKNLFADLYVGDFRELPFESEFFDLVIDRGSLCCLDKSGIQHTINEIKRVLLPGGLFFSSSYADDHTSSLSGKTIQNGLTTEIKKGSLQGVGDISFFSHSEIKNLFQNGWEIKSLKHKHSIDLSNDNDVHAEWEIHAFKLIS